MLEDSPSIVLIDADVHVSYNGINKDQIYRIHRTGHLKWTPRSTDTIVFFSRDCIVGIGIITATSRSAVDVTVHTVWDRGCVDRTVVYGAWKYAHWRGRVIDAPPRNMIPVVFQDAVYNNGQFAAGLDALVEKDLALLCLQTPRISIVM